MLIDTSVKVQCAGIGVEQSLGCPSVPFGLVINAQQRRRLEFMLTKIRIFGELYCYHNTAYIEHLLETGEDRREQYTPSPDCLAVVESILTPAQPVPPVEASSWKVAEEVGGDIEVGDNVDRYAPPVVVMEGGGLVAA